MFTVNGEKLSPTSFPDKTCSLRLHARDDGYTIGWKYDGDHECMLLWNLVHHIRANNGEDTPIGLYMPYIPNARMDRVKNCDEVFTLKWFAEFINSLHFTYVQVFDPHSNVSEALINHVEPITAHDCIESVIDELNSKRNMNVLLCYPCDVGDRKIIMFCCVIPTRVPQSGILLCSRWTMYSALSIVTGVLAELSVWS